MPRLPFTLASAASLLLFLATVALKSSDADFKVHGLKITSQYFQYTWWIDPPAAPPTGSWRILGIQFQRTAEEEWHTAKRLGTVAYLLIPVHVPMIATAIPPALWFAFAFRASRSRPPALCPTCSYNLTGNTSGTCPECGTPVPAKPQP